MIVAVELAPLHPAINDVFPKRWLTASLLVADGKRVDQRLLPCMDFIVLLVAVRARKIIDRHDLGLQPFDLLLQRLGAMQLVSVLLGPGISLFFQNLGAGLGGFGAFA